MANYKEENYLVTYRDDEFGYWYMTFKPYVSFKKGQEEIFIKMMRDFKDYHVRKNEHVDCYAKERLEYMMKSYWKLDWSKIWETYDLQEYTGPLQTLLEQILKYIDWETFRNKVDEYNDLVLVRRFYTNYAHYNNKNIRIVDKAFKEYLNKALKRMKKTPEKALLEIIDDYEETFQRGHENRGAEYYLYNSKAKLFNILLSVANLDARVTYNNKKVLLKDLILYKILRNGRIKEWISDESIPHLKLSEGQREELKNLLDNYKGQYFSKNVYDTDLSGYDRASLNFLTDKVDKVFEAFEDEDFEVYDYKQLSYLFKSGFYKTEGKPFVDRFANIMRFLTVKPNIDCMKGGLLRVEFLDFIYSDKVKVISYQTLLNIKNYLSEKEFSDYLCDLAERKVPIYFGDYLGLKKEKDEVKELDINVADKNVEFLDYIMYDDNVNYDIRYAPYTNFDENSNKYIDTKTNVCPQIIRLLSKECSYYVSNYEIGEIKKINTSFSKVKKNK